MFWILKFIYRKDSYLAIGTAIAHYRITKRVKRRSQRLHRRYAAFCLAWSGHFYEQDGENANQITSGMSNVKRILVIGINSLPEPTGIGKYTGEMLSWLAEKGYEVTMVTAYPYYPQWKLQQPTSGLSYRKERPSKGITLYRCPMYIPSRPTAFKRGLHELTFFLSAFLMICRLLFKRRYDMTFVIAPPFHLGYLGLFYRMLRGTPVTYHIQDLQIESAQRLGMIRSSRLLSWLLKVERHMLNAMDHISTVAEGMRKKVEQKTSKTVSLFPNWVDTISYYPVVNADNLKRRWGFSSADELVVYSGSIGEKQGLDGLLRVAQRLCDQPHIKFIICGTGPFKERLVRMAAELNLGNVSFLPVQSNRVFNNFLNIGTVHLVLHKEDQADMVMPSKLNTILSVGGLAIVTTHPGTSLYKVIKENKMGLVVPPQDDEALAKAILRCCSSDFSKIRRNARDYAEQNLSREVILQKINALL